ncbi:MAG: DUF503 domain-containing protein [Acidimicrobiales bacterium]
MHVAACEIELHIASSHSLKDKRAVVRHIVDTARRRFGVSASEVGYHDLWQRSVLGFAYVAADVGRVEEILDALERFVWSDPGVEVLSVTRRWLEDET